MTVVWSPEIGFGPNGTYEFPDDDGVYVISEIINGQYVVRYVGQGNIYRRMEDHKSSSEQNDCLRRVMSDLSNVKVKSTIINNKTERDNVEYTYYQHYLNEGHRLCNDLTPSGQWLVGIPLPF